MLPAPQVEVCGACHDTQGSRDRMRIEGRLTTAARPRLLATALAQRFVHPLDDKAYSRHEPGVVTCSSCHSPHRGRLDAPDDPVEPGVPRRSSCHGGSGLSTRDSFGISSLFDVRARSSHPVEAPAAESSPSVIAELSGREINCTDCHGNSDPNGARGPHGSGVRFLLRAEHVTTDGNNEAARTYALCYGCHDRQLVLDSTLFPEHRRHVVEVRSACSTCHNPHGSPDNRALIRFGDPAAPSPVSPSGLSGRLAFASDSPGSGACFLTCHGYDHAPAVYGTLAPLADELISAPEEPDLRGRPQRTGRSRTDGRRRDD